MNDFIKLAEELYPGYYDYPEIDCNCIDDYTEISLICKKCGTKFKTTPYDLLSYGGCECEYKDIEILSLETEELVEENRTFYLGGKEISDLNEEIKSDTYKKPGKVYKKTPRLTRKEFIQRSEEKYGVGTYGYDLVPNDIRSNVKVKIYCPICKEYFEIAPSKFLYKRCKGCPKCSHRKMGLRYKTPQEEWISRAQSKWGDVCDYSKTVYTGANNEVEVFCKEHQGYFRQRASTHMRGAYGCPICSFGHIASESIGGKGNREYS